MGTTISDADAQSEAAARNEHYDALARDGNPLDEGEEEGEDEAEDEDEDEDEDEEREDTHVEPSTPRKPRPAPKRRADEDADDEETPSKRLRSTPVRPFPETPIMTCIKSEPGTGNDSPLAPDGAVSFSPAFREDARRSVSPSPFSRRAKPVLPAYVKAEENDSKPRQDSLESRRPAGLSATQNWFWERREERLKAQRIAAEKRKEVLAEMRRAREAEAGEIHEFLKNWRGPRVDLWIANAFASS